MYNSENMSSFLGPDVNDHEARAFAMYLEERGWELDILSDGQYHAFRNGEEMTEQEWQSELSSSRIFPVNPWLMNPETGTVHTRSEWIEIYEDCDDDQWGGENFDDANLVEVVPNIPGTEGYDDRYGDWR